MVAHATLARGTADETASSGWHTATIDPFDRVQLACVLRTCLASRSLSGAGRQLFSISRLSKSTPNDADRLRKYFGLRYPLDS